VTYAIAPHIAGGICDPNTLRKLADVAEKYHAAALKITGAQRIAIVGLKEEDLDNAWADLCIKPGAAVGMCVRSIKVCPGTTFCKRGVQDSVGLGLALDAAYHGMTTPSKFKIGVSGCPNSCGESWLKDLGFLGTPKGFKCIVGGDAGRTPRIGRELAASGHRPCEGAGGKGHTVLPHQRQERNASAFHRPHRLGEVRRTC
jgi:NAD(P)H-nitrite reductase large subunit